MMQNIIFNNNFVFEKNSLSFLDKCFILGNGPTLNKFKLHNLHNEFTVGVNQILRSGFSPSVICITDINSMLYDEDVELLKNTKAKFIFAKHIVDKLKERGIQEDRVCKSFYLNCKPFFSHDYSYLWKGDLEETRHTGSVVGDICIPLCIYLGIKNIYLLGMDEYWDINNFKNSHFFKKILSNSDTIKMRNSIMRNIWFGKQDLLARMNGVRIINLSPGSALKAFERADANILFPNLINMNVVNCIGKFIKLRGDFYQITNANNNDLNACSLKNIKNNNFIRHYNGKVIFSNNESDESLKDDSSFIPEPSFIDVNQISFRSCNLKNTYITRDVYADVYHMRLFSDDFLASESSFSVLDSNDNINSDLKINSNSEFIKIVSSDLISDNDRDQYRNLHEMNLNYGNSSHRLIPEISLLIKFLNPKTVLDYGCGKGLLINLLHKNFENINFFNYDPCIEQYSHIPQNKFDMIINTDVLEHIPEYNIDRVLCHMKSLSDNIFFCLHHEKAFTILPNGENAHCTIKPPKWYHEKIRKIFGECIPLISRGGPNTAAITFKLTYEQLFDYSYMIIKAKNSEIKKMKKQIKMFQQK